MKVNIIGGGVAGLAVGIYLQKNGFETEVFEQHTVPGGLCTGWKRGDYTFNGCMHWLLGSGKGIAFNTFWNEILDLSHLEFVLHEERVQFDVPDLKDRHGNSVFHFYNEIDQFEKYMLDIAPEDEKMIRYWMDQVRYVGQYLDCLPPAFYDESFIASTRRNMHLIKLLPMVYFMFKWSKLTNYQFAENFKNPFLRKAITLLYEKEVRMPILFFVQCYANKHVAGYPIGSSLHFAKKLAESYQQHGGKLTLGQCVNSIDIEEGRAVGLRMEDNTQRPCDYVVSAADWRWTIFRALGEKYATKEQMFYKNPPKEAIFYSYCILYLGVDLDLKKYPHFIRYSLENPIFSPDGTSYDRLEVHVYNYDPTLAPEGKVTIAVDFQTREGEFWINLRKNDYPQYVQKKKEFQENILAELEKKMSVLSGHIEVTDLTTPASYHRYTGNTLGSSQGWTPQDNVMKSIPLKPTVKGLDNVFLAGHWLVAGGGLPIALKSARDTAWLLSKKANGKFVV